MIKNILLFIPLVIGILVLSGCAQVAEEKEPITLVLNVWPGFSHAIIAKERGFFEEEGLDVNLIILKDYSESINLFFEGKNDAIFEVYTDTIKQAADGLPLKVVYVADYSNGGDVIVSKPEIKTVADLKGKRVGIDGFNGFSHLFVNELLRRNGLQESDVKLLEVSGMDVADALESDKIDAGHTWEPVKTEAIANGNRLLASSEDTPGIITDVLVFRKEFVEKRPEDVKKIVKSLFKALEYMETDENAAFAIMSEGTGTTPGSLKEGLSGIKLVDFEGNKIAFSKSEETTSLYKSGEVISAFFVEKNIIEKPIDLETLIAPGFIEDLR